jgi:hypothetical protein
LRKEVGFYEDFFLIMSSMATHDEEGIVSFFSPPFASYYLLLFVSNRDIMRETLGKPSSLSQTFLGSWFLGSLSFSDSVSDKFILKQTLLSVQGLHHGTQTTRVWQACRARRI